MAFKVTGSWNTWNQADSPANCGVPSPSQAKKDSTTTPNSGSSANTPKKLSAGASSQLLGPVCNRLYLAWPDLLSWPAGPSRSETVSSRDGPSLATEPAGDAAGDCAGVMSRA